MPDRPRTPEEWARECEHPFPQGADVTLIRDALTRRCDLCDAAPGDRCRSTKSGEPTQSPHSVRIWPDDRLTRIRSLAALGRPSPTDRERDPKPPTTEG